MFSHNVKWLIALLALLVIIPSSGYVINGIRNRNSPLPSPLKQISQRRPDTTAAKQSTTAVRRDLRIIKNLANEGRWSEARRRFALLQQDWEALERATLLSNRNFINGMNRLKSQLRDKDTKGVNRTIYQLDQLIVLLEATF